MSSKRPHLIFNNAQEAFEDFSYKSRLIDSDGDDENRDYSTMQDSFRANLQAFETQRRLKHQRRNIELNVPEHVDYVKIKFFEVFEADKYENTYIRSFGLIPVKFSFYNKVGLFAIRDENRFENFLDNIQAFINSEDPNNDDNFLNHIKFIKSFDLLGREEMLKIGQSSETITLDLVKSIRLFSDTIVPILRALIDYLDDKEIIYSILDSAEVLEIKNANWETVLEITDNFDIIHTISSHDYGLIRPDEIGHPVREFGFNINENGIEDLPIIGVVDTGVDRNTPISTVLVDSDGDYDLTNTSAYIDNTDHGTGVACLAALGKTPYPEFEGSYDADARILPIKILDNSSSKISQLEVINLIKKANDELDVKIFVITVTYVETKKDHEEIDKYAYLLDKIAYEKNLLIFISTGNRINLYDGFDLPEYPKLFESQDSNLCTPAESLNNITVGAISDNFDDTNTGLTPDKDSPAVYTRKSHYNWDYPEDLKGSLRNIKLLKPDLLYSGGDLDEELNPDPYGLQVLSSTPGLFFIKEAGTSYSAPLVTNLAAKILKEYPNIEEMQSVKALIINSCRKIDPSNGFEDLSINLRRNVIGNGTPNEDYCLYSDDNRVTFLYEGEIEPNKMEIYKINLPEYLNTLDKKRGILKVNATLCFSFEPVPDNQLSYCPIHIAFGFFKNISVDTLLDKDIKLEEKKLKQGWTEDYYFKSSLLSNTQKIDFSISRKDLVNENNTIKLGIHSLLHGRLHPAQSEKYSQKNPFSLVITIEEKMAKGKNKDRLYSEMKAINQLSAITDLDIELEA